MGVFYGHLLSHETQNVFRIQPSKEKKKKEVGMVDVAIVLSKSYEIYNIQSLY